MVQFVDVLRASLTRCEYRPTPPLSTCVVIPCVASTTLPQVLTAGVDLWQLVLEMQEDDCQGGLINLFPSLFTSDSITKVEQQTSTRHRRDLLRQLLLEPCMLTIRKHQG